MNTTQLEYSHPLDGFDSWHTSTVPTHTVQHSIEELISLGYAVRIVEPQVEELYSV